MNVSQHPPKRRASQAREDLVIFVRTSYAQLQASAMQLWRRDSVQDRIEDHEDYKAAVEFRQTFAPKDGVDYAWVCEYAEKHYRWLEERFQYLDEKADSIIKYLGGGTGVIALAAVAGITRDNAPIILLMVPSVLLALRAIYLAVSARNPDKTDMPPGITGAVQYAESYGEKGRTIFMGQWHQSCEGMALVVSRKAEKVKQANWFYFWALMCLLFPLVVGVAWKWTQPVRPVPPVLVKIVQ